jgi:hypothetical protein
MGYVSTVLRIQVAFEKAGIQFTEEDESGGDRRPDNEEEAVRA